ncbi:unnamed protein product [Phytophthora lilii]|uniref:Unnamed protein product n=1 Tax=Phytophthora lilii TaxID=2077276 RepID=A0A9W6TNT5_9STRA|nr:unnamed protein product [Phytophthora lilii]
MATKRRQSIEVFRLRLRETVNEGEDGDSVAGGSSRSLLSLPEQEAAPQPPESRHAQRRQSPADTEGRTAARRRVRVEIDIDEDSDEELAASQEIKIDVDSDEDIDGREPSERRKPCLIASSSSGDDGSTRTMRCSLDAADSPPPAADAEVRTIESVAQLDETIDTPELLAAKEPEARTAEVQTVPRANASLSPQSKDNIRESRRVVLVTRPSQRTMVKSTGSSARPTPTSAQSRRWVLEYKPVVRHSGWLIKRGYGLRNFKRRLFCIVDNELIYHDTHDATEVRGRLNLTRKSTVQCMLHSGFKFAQGSYSMVLYAMDNHDRDVWIRKLQEHNVQLLPEGAKTAKLMKQHSDNADKGGLILFSGWLRKRGRMVKSTKRRWFELSNTTLSYFAHPQGGSRKGTIDVSHARVSPVDTLKTGERHSFQICTPSRNLFLHADSQEERSLWLAALASVGEGSANTAQNGATSSKPDTNEFAMPTSASEFGRMCKCGAMDEGGAAVDGVCRRCMSSFISNTEDAMVDVAREVQLLLASPYSPEGCTSAAFLKEHTGRPVSNATVREFMTGLSDYLVHTRLKELLMLAGVAQPDGNSDSDSDDDGVRGNAKVNPAHPQDAAVLSEITNNIQTIVHEQIEERVFFPLYRAILTNVRAQTREDAKVLKGKIEILRSKSQAFFGIGPDSVSSSKWFSACSKLREVDKVSLPYMKRAQLLAACKEIYAIYHTEHPTQPPMSADAFIPAFIYVLIHSRLRDPVALKELITFFDWGCQQGEIAYFVTCLEIALEYIRSLLTACTVVLSSSRKLGIEFSKHPEADVVVVHRLVPGEQAQQSGAINVGDVLVAVNGLPVYEMELAEVVKLWRGVDGEAEFCFLPFDEYLRKLYEARIVLGGIAFFQHDSTCCKAFGVNAIMNKRRARYLVHRQIISYSGGEAGGTRWLYVMHDQPSPSTSRAISYLYASEQRRTHDATCSVRASIIESRLPDSLLSACIELHLATMLGSNDFQRVKSMWQTRIGRSKSSESASSQETSVQEVTTPSEAEQEYHESVVANKVEPATPHTPAIDADFHKYALESVDHVTKPATNDGYTPVSPASSTSTSASASSPSTSPEKLPDKPPSNPVTSMFRTFSDACVFPSILNKPPPAPSSSTSSSVSSTLLSFAPPIPTPWRSSRSASDSTASSSSSSSSSFLFASVSLTSALPPREAAENAINNVHNVCSRCRIAVSGPISRGSPYGELVVVDILEARGLAVDRNQGGVDLPFDVTMQLGRLSRKTRPADRKSFAVNERFVFWLQSSPTIDQRTLDIFVHGSDDRDLGEVHLSLSMPVNEAYTDWYPLVCRADGLKHGSLRVAMRRLVLTSSPMLEAAQSLGERKGSLSFNDSKRYGELLPELWSCFPGSEAEVTLSSPPKEDAISSKLGRLIGFQEQVQRDVF